ncbi:hypothetical protein OAC70_04920, partial [Flavobacteriaceae bacterium]|nr:hypothetical protein [Flavobacteriaceae bacterium]
LSLFSCIKDSVDQKSSSFFDETFLNKTIVVAGSTLNDALLFHCHRLILLLQRQTSFALLQPCCSCQVCLLQKAPLFDQTIN